MSHFLISSLTLIVFAVPTFASVTSVQDCYLSENPDSGVRLQILNLADSGTEPLLIAAVSSTGNIRPNVLSTYPVQLTPPNGAGIVAYSAQGFYFQRDLQTMRLQLDDATAGLHMTGTALDSFPKVYKCDN